MKMEFDQLSELQLDALKEIGNIGTGNVATALSKLMNKRIHMNVPSVKIISFNQMSDIVGGPEELIVALFFRIHGEVQGTVYLIFSLHVAEALVMEVTGKKNFTLFNHQPDEFALSALKEIGNIMTSSYTSALADLMDVKMQPSIPYVTADMAGAILVEGLIQLSPISDYAIVINTEIHNEHHLDQLGGYFFLLPDYDSFHNIFKALGMEKR